MKVKYILLNMKVNIKSYITIFAMVTLMVFALMCSFAIRRNVLEAQEEGLSRYVFVVIAPEPDYFSDPSKITGINEDGEIITLQERILIDDDFISIYAMDEYVIDYYGFVEGYIYPTNLSYIKFPGLPDNYETYIPGLESAYSIIDGKFTVVRYTDISKSTHFTMGTRVITEGRFAVNEYEFNASEELAALNNLSVGSVIEMTHLNQLKAFTLVGIYANHGFESTRELPFVSDILNDNGIYTRVVQDSSNLSENFILLYADPNSMYYIPLQYDSEGGYYYEQESERIYYGYDAAVYRLHNERDVVDFKEALIEVLDEQFMVLDSLDIVEYIRHVLNKTSNSFTWLFAVILAISVILCSLLFSHILKSRIYDIGVYRAKGMSLTKVAFTLTSEIIIISVLSFLAAGILYITTFIYVSNAMYYLQDIFVSNDRSFYMNFSPEVINAAREYEFTATVYPIALIYGFVAVIAFTVIIGFATTLFISRHEPMKTMTKV